MVMENIVEVPFNFEWDLFSIAAILIKHVF